VSVDLSTALLFKTIKSVDDCSFTPHPSHPYCPVYTHCTVSRPTYQLRHIGLDDAAWEAIGFTARPLL